MSESGRRAISADYDSDPERFLSGAAIAPYRLVSDVHDELVERVTKEGLRPVLDIGCGDGRSVGRS